MDKLSDSLSPDFLKQLYESAANWVITALPSIIITFLLLLISLRVLSFAINKFKELFAKLYQKKEIDSKENEKRLETLIGILKGAGKIVVWIVFVIIILQKFGLNIGPLLASAGIVGLAIGFGAQEIVRDFFSGFFMLLENQIRSGDVAIINGTGGLVERVDLRTTTLRDFSGTVHVFQNGKIQTLSNMTKEWSAMVFDVGVAYKENVDNVMEIMKQVGDGLHNDDNFKNKFIEPIEVFGVDEFGDSAVAIKARIKTQPIEQWNVGREYRKRLKARFDEMGIEIPFPHRTIYWGNKNQQSFALKNRA